MNDKIEVRWMIRRDMGEILDIEKESFSSPWAEEDFIKYLKERNVIGMVAEIGDGNDDQIVGYMVYSLYKDRLELKNFAVHPDFRRQGVGTKLAEKLKGKLSTSRRTRVVTHVSEGNYRAQKFFSSKGFRATGVIKNHFSTGEDAYAFQYEVKHPLEAPANRISFSRGKSRG